ncbi:MAG: hypothetical protein IJI98_02060 [Methanosphaera sp.]|nr:hypothetical protein [Methanosphaera sp.]
MFNKKAIFTVAMLLIILTSLTIISATNTTDDNTHDISPQQIKETPTINTNNTKTIHKDTTQKITQTKKATSTVNSYSGLLSEISNAKTSTDDEYIINLEEGDYTISTPITWSGSQNTKKLTINGNGNTIDGQNSKRFLTIEEDYTIILNNITLLNCQGGSDGNIKK